MGNTPSDREHIEISISAFCQQLPKSRKFFDILYSGYMISVNDRQPLNYVVMGRGIEKQKNLFDDQEGADFILRLAGLARDQSMKIFGWPLLPHHSSLFWRWGMNNG